MRRRAGQADDRSLFLLLRWALPPALLVVAIDLVASYAFDVDPFTWRAYAFDALLVVYFALCFYELQRDHKLAAVLACLFFGALIAIAWGKVAVLGTPPRYKDLGLVWDALRVADPPLRYGVLAALTALACAMLWNLRLPKPSALALFLPAIGYWVVLGLKAFVPPVGAAIPVALPTYWYQGFQQLGHNLMMLNEPIRHFDRQESLRRASTVAPEDLPTALADATLPPLARRNLHVVMVESLFDVTQLRDVGFSRDPLTPLFRQWQALPRTTSISPVFGGKSSNPEFEVLCGLPVAIDDGQVLFWDLAKPEIACLPRLLRAQGWTASTFVPVPGEFFNARNAYRMIGFDRHVTIAELDASDMDGLWLSAEATIRQNLAEVEKLRAAGKPYLNYMFVVAGHFNYWLNPRRPSLIRTTPEDDALLQRYVNGLHYNMLAVEDFVARVRRDDPEALIVILGDHAPPLGANFAAYRRGGMLAAGERAEHAVALFETPILVLDRGEMLPLGRLPQYLVPEVILDRLSDGAYCRTNRCGYRSERVLRPYATSALLVERQGKDVAVCPNLDAPQNGDCALAARQSRYLQKKVFELIE